ncbi:hypothetical protein BLNAU_18679 [Blattamonas nauphoetae]|uniref:Protein kinase domain-containing protein n=1 Tax=Blattamonas nauphoetae TaxID=2049346 RepID=A0ABQ9X4C0_9EUKA|nr:hypothetical protein BLNAU_18679 [Blattamonas nauphoetae]
MPPQPASNSIDPSNYKSPKPFSSSKSSCLEYCLDQQGSSVTFRRAERLSSIEKELFEEEFETVTALEAVEGTKVAAQYAKWDKSRPDAVYGIMDVDPGTNLKLLMDRWKTEQKQWTDDDLLLLVVQLVYPLKYMHTKFIHRAIRSDCIFLETAKPAVFANFQYALRYNQESGEKTSAPYVKNGLDPDTPYQPSNRIRPRETNLDDPLYDSRVDIWAIGLILHEIAYGKSIFGNANDIQILTKIQQNQFDIIQYDPLHPKFHAILKRMLSTDADARPTATSLLQDPQLQPAYNFLTSVPAVPMIKTNASSILNSAIPQETFPDDPRTRQNRFVQSMASPLAAGNITISVDSANPTENAPTATSSSSVNKEGAELGAGKGIRAVVVAGALVAIALVVGVLSAEAGFLVVIELAAAVIAGALGAAALQARILGTEPLVAFTLVAGALGVGALVAGFVAGAGELGEGILEALILVVGALGIGALVAGVVAGSIVARTVAGALKTRALVTGALVTGALVAGVVAGEVIRIAGELDAGDVAGILGTGPLMAGALVAGVVVGARVVEVVTGALGATELGTRALVAGTLAAGALVAEVVAGIRVAGALATGVLGAGALVVGALEARSLETRAHMARAFEAGALVAGALLAGALGAGLLSNYTILTATGSGLVLSTGTIAAGTVMAAALGACGGIFGIRLHRQRDIEQQDQ